ncbi:MAG: hypothetical protein COA78_14395 [Blastopirellula sp.]|nr:MAG: hypothetical protein COA78_14395 [Blastopirellula sp.]
MNIRQQKKSKEFFDLSIDLYCILNQAHHLLFVNKAFYELLGYSEETVLNRSLIGYVQLADREKFSEGLSTLAPGDGVVEFESRLISANGTDRHFRWRINIPEGSEELYATARDITDQKRHSSIIEQTHRIAKVGGWEYNFITHELFWTDETYRLHDTTPEEFTPDVSRAIDLYAPESVPVITEALRAAQEEGKDWDLELQLITLKGRKIWVRAVGQVERVNGQSIKVFGSFQDITERKILDEEREDFIAALEQKNDELERFTYTVSHDLKSPLVTIKSYAGLLKEDLKNQAYDEVEIDLNSIASACDTLNALLRDLLELSRVGRVINPGEWMSLRDLVEVTSLSLQGRIRETGATISVAGETGQIFGDRARLLEVFQNLIDNAMKYRSDLPPHVEISSVQNEDNITICIADNGKGIAPDFHGKIFDLFEQLHSSDEGTGIGLAIVKRVVEHHGGKIWVESVGYNQGSRFYIQLPLVDRNNTVTSTG